VNVNVPVRHAHGDRAADLDRRGCGCIGTPAVLGKAAAAPRVGPHKNGLEVYGGDEPSLRPVLAGCDCCELARTTSAMRLAVQAAGARTPLARSNVSLRRTMPVLAPHGRGQRGCSKALRTQRSNSRLPSVVRSACAWARPSPSTWITAASTALATQNPKGTA
jgi:hypothetical protein